MDTDTAANAEVLPSVPISLVECEQEESSIKKRMSGTYDYLLKEF